jgi:hypothetical protein
MTSCLDPAECVRIRHQRLELPALGRADPALCRRLFRRCEGPREKDFNMRWIASLVADCYRILIRGGVFLYPADKRKGYGSGRIRLVYEANPIAFLVEQAGGAATDSVNRILDIQPASLHQRIPLVFGSKSKVERIARYHVDPEMISERSPCSETAVFSGFDPLCQQNFPSYPLRARQARAPRRSSRPSRRSLPARRSPRPSSRAMHSTASTARR